MTKSSYAIPGKGRGGKSAPPSPLYTSKSRELTKLELLAEKGKDSDGAFRVHNRKDATNNE